MTAIKIKLLSGNIQSMNIEDTDTGLSLKNQLESKIGIKYDQIRLIHSGKMLNDNSTLLSQNIKAGSTIHMVMSLRGG